MEKEDFKILNVKSMKNTFSFTFLAVLFLSKEKVLFLPKVCHVRKKVLLLVNHYITLEENVLILKYIDLILKLIKNIPMQAGLAGGSTDCASFIIGLNKLFNLNLSQNELGEFGKKLGADVVPCMHKLVKSEGIGDIITPLSSNLKYYILIVKPDFKCNTKIMYQKLDSNKNIKQSFNTDKVINILKNGNTKDLKNKLLSEKNTLKEEINELRIKKEAINADKEISDLKKKLKEI